MDSFILALIATGTNWLGFLLLARSNHGTIKTLLKDNRDGQIESAASLEKRVIVLETKISLLEGQLYRTQETVHNLMFVFTSHPKELPINREASSTGGTATTIR